MIILLIVAVKNANNANLVAAAKVAFKNCLSFKNCRTKINDTFVDEADYINISMPKYNLIEYSDNYSDTLGMLGQSKRDEVVNNASLTVANSSSFKYESNFVGYTDNNGDLTCVKIAVRLKSLSKF